MDASDIPSYRDGISDEAISQQAAAIAAEIAAKQPLVGDIEPPSVLLEEYRDNPQFLPKIQVRNKHPAPIRLPRVVTDLCRIYASSLAASDGHEATATAFIGHFSFAWPRTSLRPAWLLQARPWGVHPSCRPSTSRSSSTWKSRSRCCSRWATPR